MKIVGLVLVGVVVAQSVTRLSVVRWLAVLFVLSGFAAALFTGWQYTYGIGVRLEQFPQTSRLAELGLRTNDIVDIRGQPQRPHSRATDWRRCSNYRSDAKGTSSILGVHGDTVEHNRGDAL